MQCVVCGASARYRAHYPDPLYFCSSACQRAHWTSEGEELVRVRHVNLNCESFTKEDMGRAGWFFLHALADALAEDEECEDAVALITLLRRLYPCEMCREHFDEMVRRAPPPTSSGRLFRRWLCERHNEVNRRLGKPEWVCAGERAHCQE